MAGLGTLLLILLMPVAPNGHVLGAALAPPDVRRQLPVDAFSHLLPRVWVVFHDNRDAMMAFYTPGGAAGGPDLSVALRGADQENRRLLPGFRVPRIFLYEPYYLEDGRLLPADRMTIDVAQYFFETLLEALLDLLPPDGMEERASRYGEAPPGGGPVIPPAQRRDAYVSALSQFGSEAISVAAELRRILARARAAGRDPCQAVDLPATLYGQWGRVFTSVEYRGFYRPAAPGGRPSGRWILGPSIDRSDKRFLVEQVLEDFWTGDVRRDFQLDCP